MLFWKFGLRSRKQGMAVLPVVLIIGGLIVEIGIAGLFISYFLNSSGFGVKISEEALMAAQSGIDDAIIKIIRNKGEVFSSTFSLVIGNNSTEVEILKDIPSNGKYQIISSGSAGLKRRKLKAVINIDNNDGEVKIEYSKEIEI